MAFGKHFKRVTKPFSKVGHTYSKVASTRQGQIGIAVATTANPYGAALRGSQLANVDALRHTLETAKFAGVYSHGLTKGARKGAGKTFGKYYALGASKLTGGASDKALAVAGAFGVGKISGINDVVDGWQGAPPDAPTDTPSAPAAPVEQQSDTAHTDAAPDFPVLLIAGGVLVVGLVLIIALRK